MWFFCILLALAIICWVVVVIKNDQPGPGADPEVARITVTPDLESPANSKIVTSDQDRIIEIHQQRVRDLCRPQIQLLEKQLVNLYNWKWSDSDQDQWHLQANEFVDTLLLVPRDVARLYLKLALDTYDLPLRPDRLAQFEQLRQRLDSN